MYITKLTHAQSMPAIEGYSLETEEDYIDADKISPTVADYLFATPMVTDNENRIKASAFLNRWMDGTPTYTFVIDEGILEYFDNDPELTDMYMAALTRFTLQNPEIKNKDKIAVGALKQVLDYSNDDKNMVVQTKKLQQLLTANQNNRLEKELNL
ncbi:MAG: hypothetical protein EOP47_11850 [Sphingobacteriaceae bacterium]|nr:MAG: hypothetical protein EOP47_11850 [Sphingobacteriaceae bacterium]